MFLEFFTANAIDQYLQENPNSDFAESVNGKYKGIVEKAIPSLSELDKTLQNRVELQSPGAFFVSTSLDEASAYATAYIKPSVEQQKQNTSSAQPQKHQTAEQIIKELSKEVDHEYPNDDQADESFTRMVNETLQSSKKLSEIFENRANTIDLTRQDFPSSIPTVPNSGLVANHENPPSREIIDLTAEESDEYLRSLPQEELIERIRKIQLEMDAILSTTSLDSEPAVFTSESNSPTPTFRITIDPPLEMLTSHSSSHNPHKKQRLSSPSIAPSKEEVYTFLDQNITNERIKGALKLKIKYPQLSIEVFCGKDELDVIEDFKRAAGCVIQKYPRLRDKLLPSSISPMSGSEADVSESESDSSSLASRRFSPDTLAVPSRQAFRRISSPQSSASSPVLQNASNHSDATNDAITAAMIASGYAVPIELVLPSIDLSTSDSSSSTPFPSHRPSSAVSEDGYTSENAEQITSGYETSKESPSNLAYKRKRRSFSEKEIEDSKAFYRAKKKEIETYLTQNITNTDVRDCFIYYANYRLQNRKTGISHIVRQFNGSGKKIGVRTLQTYQLRLATEFPQLEPLLYTLKKI